MPAGKRFDDFLDEQLQAARCVVVLWSRGSIHSPWVKDEAAVGRERGILVPARLDDVSPPFGFRAIHAANLIGWQGDDSQWGFQQLLRDIRAAVEAPARVVSAITGEPTPPISRPEERQGREQEEAEAMRQAADEERQRLEQQEAGFPVQIYAAEAMRQADEEERQQAEAQRTSEQEAQQRVEAKREWRPERQPNMPAAAHDVPSPAPSLATDITGKTPSRGGTWAYQILFWIFFLIILPLTGLLAIAAYHVGNFLAGIAAAITVVLLTFFFHNRAYRRAANYGNGSVQSKLKCLQAKAKKWLAILYVGVTVLLLAMPDSPYRMAIKYRDGIGVTQDYAEAVKWFRKAADQGNASAQNDFGVMYDEGEGVPKDHAEAVKWYQKAADQGDAVAQVNLGERYRDGKGVAKDDAEAVRWYRKAADQGNALAQYNLGLMYAFGEGVAKDEAEAMK
jgi:TPR repeat protein